MNKTENTETAVMENECSPEYSEEKDRLESNILDQFIEMTNIAPEIDDEDLSKIAQDVIAEYDIDKQSREEWEKRNKESMKLAQMISETKNTPWAGAANIKYPIIAQATLQFAARASSNLIRDTQIVKGKVVGKDSDGEKKKRAMRIGEHMSYQILERMDGWEDGMDRLLMVLPIIGICYKKTWYDPVEEKNVSEYYSADDVVINYWAKSIDKVNRITHVYTLYPNEIKERQLNGTFLDFEIGEASPDADNKKEVATNDSDAPHTFYEQHKFLDLDKDGYKEPYIVTIHKEKEKVVRIVARWDIKSVKRNKDNKIIRIKPTQYFTKYGFLPPFDGSFYDIGFGILLENSNKVINTTINQLLDAGTINNLSGGFVSKKVALKTGREGGTLEFDIGEWKLVNHMGDDLSKMFYKIPTNEPSTVLYNLLTLMIDSAKEFSSSMDIMAGKTPAAGVPATTTLTMLEQGLQTYTSIFRRVHRSLKQEFKKLYRLNKLYLSDTDYYTVLDEPQAISAQDYNTDDCDVVPVSNPEVVTNSQIMMKAQALMELVTTNQITDPAKRMKIQRRYLLALGVDDVDEIISEEDIKAMAGQPNPEEQMAQEELAINKEKNAIEKEKNQIESMKVQSEAKKLEMEAGKLNAEISKIIAETQNMDVEVELKASERENDILKRENEKLISMLDNLIKAKEKAEKEKEKAEKESKRSFLDKVRGK